MLDWFFNWLNNLFPDRLALSRELSEAAGHNFSIVVKACEIASKEQYPLSKSRVLELIAELREANEKNKNNSKGTHGNL